MALNMKRVVTVKMANGGYKVLTKTFTNVHHMERYIDKMESSGNKVVGMTFVTKEQEI